MESDLGEKNEEQSRRTFSLLTLADLALALQDQVEDHTYARNFDVPQVLDAQCLLVKERDHNYSTCSRTELRGRAKSNYVKRCSSEENLTSTNLTEGSSRTLPFDYSFTSRKSQSCEEVVNTIFPQNEIEITTSGLNKEEICSINKLCSSWPKEYSVLDNLNPSLSLKYRSVSPPLQQTICDHTYACDNVDDENKDKVVMEKELAVSLIKDHSYGVVKGKFSFNDPHKIARRAKLFKNAVIEQGKTCKKVVSKTDFQPPFDHNYTFRPVQPHQSKGSVESLEMELSESDTDSCDETIEEESKLNHKMFNAQQDHPYSVSSY